MSQLDVQSGVRDHGAILELKTTTLAPSPREPSSDQRYAAAGEDWIFTNLGHFLHKNWLLIVINWFSHAGSAPNFWRFNICRQPLVGRIRKQVTCFCWYKDLLYRPTVQTYCTDLLYRPTVQIYMYKSAGRPNYTITPYEEWKQSVSHCQAEEAAEWSIVTHSKIKSNMMVALLPLVPFCDVA